MNYSFIKKTMLTVAAAGMLAGCGSGFTIVSPPIENIDSTPIKTTAMSEVEAKNWKDLDLQTDTIPGMSVNKAYTEILKGRMGTTTVVAVIDSGIDIEHEDLDGVIWTNEDEIPGNGIDDDKNGYIDDVHGWNFLGNIVDENLEYERIVRDKAMLPADIVAKAQKEYDAKLAQATQSKERFEGILQQIVEADKVVSAHLGKSDYTPAEVAAISSEDETVNNAKGTLSFFFGQGLESVAQAKEVLGDYITDATNLLNGEKLKSNYREDAMPGNNPYSYTPGEIWGDNQYSGPDPEKADAFHGTHVAGIIASERDNGLGVNGVANNVKIMVLRAVSMGDEYDKDIAAAIRYAADNGAKVINGSFGKYHSSNPEFVWDAIKYAESKDVLFVNAAGNEGTDTDFTQVYPQDQELAGPEISDNFLTVGALAPSYGADMPASFSNYGKATVDVFGPGAQIYSTAPLNEYRNASGTSMASPAVAGVAAVIRSQFPKLSASQVKHIIMDSGLTTMARVNVGGGADTKPFQEITTSGKMANLYNALIMASKM
ncbi:S8 family peptidase [Nonlabens ulvanivorans]|uniref:S8 family peptidase n=1 Tax=Nonlabens ulvanivorans TaxID=906888 RepID=UPI0037C61607